MARRVRRAVRGKRSSRIKAASEIAEKQAIAEADRAASELDAASAEAAIGRGRPLAHGVADVDDEAIEAGREAYESVLKTNVAADFARFEQLRAQGAKDVFDPNASSADVEKKGPLGAAAHLIRLFDQWILDGADRDTQIDKAATFLASFSRYDVVRKVLIELESKPIRDIYPLEVMIAILEKNPAALPGVTVGPVITNAEHLTDDDAVFAGHPVQIQLPKDVRVKHFAPLDGVRVGYEFFPSPDEGKYTLLLDTPGRWELALFAAPTEQLGRMTRETQGGTVDIFEVDVREMGKKAPPSA